MFLYFKKKNIITVYQDVMGYVFEKMVVRVHFQTYNRKKKTNNNYIFSEIE